MTAARDTIVGALDIASLVLCACGPEAQNMTAQGNALGVCARNMSSPERAAQKPRARFVALLQGALFCDFVSRGGAPGFHAVALSARNATCQKFSGWVSNFHQTNFFIRPKLIL